MPRFARLAGLTVLILGAAGLLIALPDTSTRAAAQGDGLTRQISIFPGFNLSVWGSTEAPADDLGEILPAAITAVFDWDPGAREFRTWRRAGPTFLNTLGSIPGNEAVWALAEGNEVVWFEQTDDGRSRATRLVAGLDLLGWTGPITAIGDAFANIPEFTVHTFDQERQEFSAYSSTLPDALQRTRELGPGTAFWIEAPPDSEVRLVGR